MNKNTGGPAFPSIATTYDDAKHEYVIGGYIEGMTLRDYFAAKAMQSLMTVMAMEPHTYEELAMAAYSQADAMLKAREA